LFIKTNITSRRIYTRVFVSTWLYLLYNLSELRRIKIETNICGEKNVVANKKEHANIQIRFYWLWSETVATNRNGATWFHVKIMTFHPHIISCSYPNPKSEITRPDPPKFSCTYMRKTASGFSSQSALLKK
jgi:uncharacterized protein YcfL